MAKHLYGMHDYDPVWASMVQAAQRTAWTVETLEIGDDPHNQSGGDFRDRTRYGLTVLGRLNYSHHGNGTIPKPDRYEAFAQRVGNYVRNSQDCTHWIIGNEPNLIGERPDKAVPIQPASYARCYALCYQEIKKISTSHQVMVAPVAPYNVDTGSWVDYWRQMLEAIYQQLVGIDGLALHTYSRGPDPASVTSNHKMDAPYQAYYNGFRGYRDLLAAVPEAYRHVPAHITETDQIESWADRNSGWVREAYKEVDGWNKTSPQKIRSLSLYRWPTFDQWWIIGKQGVIGDFQQTLTSTNYLVPNDQPPVTSTSPQAVVIAPAGANIRTGPSIAHPILGAEPFGAVLPVTGRLQDSSWWQVAWGSVLGWVSGTVVSTSNTGKVPVVAAPPTTPSTPPALCSDAWMVETLSKVLGVNPLAAQAIIAIESNGAAFGADGRPVIRFETHLFHNSVSKIAPEKLPQVERCFGFGSPPWTGQTWRPGCSGAWQPLHDGGQAEEWAAFEQAQRIDARAAALSISIGQGQVLGSNYWLLGYPSPEAMLAAFSDKASGSAAQLAGMFSYMQATGMVGPIQNRDWRTVAEKYNGSGQADYYANLIKNKFAALGGK